MHTLLSLSRKDLFVLCVFAFFIQKLCSLYLIVSLCQLHPRFFSFTAKVEVFLVIWGSLVEKFPQTICERSSRRKLTLKYLL